MNRFMRSDIISNSIRISNGEKIGYRESEIGYIPVVLVHGNMTSSKHYDLLLDRLPSQYKIYAIDLRGFGRSSYNNPIQSIDDFAEDIKLFTQALGLDSFRLMGWSLGGGVCMSFSSRYPEQVEKLILIESMGIRGFTLYDKETNKQLKTKSDIETDKALKKLFDAFERKDRRFFKSFWKKVVYTKNEPSPIKFEEYLDDVFTQKNLQDVYHALISFNISAKENGISNPSAGIDNISMPVLVIQGDRDLVNTVDTGIEIAEAIGPNAELKIIEDCGHSPFIDQLDKVTQIIIEFL